MTAEDAARQHADAFMAAMQTNTEADFLAFAENHMVADPNRANADRAQSLLRLRQRFGELSQVRIDIGGLHDVLVVGKPANERGWVLFGFQLQTEPPYRVELINLDKMMQPPEPPEADAELAKSMSLDELLVAVRKRAQADFEAGTFSGVVLLARHGEPILHEVYGQASLRFDVPNRLDTRFNVGSITKSFTKVAVGQLVSAGKLDLEAPIERYLPDYPNQEVARKVKVKHLVDHSSGIGDIFNEKYFRSSKHQYRQPQDFYPLFVDTPLAFEPGTDQRYSNAGYIVLGAVVAAAAGQDYYDYIQENVFDVAGMKDSGFFESTLPVPNVALSYTRRSAGNASDTLRETVLMRMVRGCPAGGSFSSAEDLVRFDAALRRGKLLDEEHTNWFFGGPPKDKTGKIHDGTIGIAGGAPGVNAVLESDGDMAVVVLSNFDPPSAEKLGRWIWQRLRRVQVTKVSGTR